MHKIKVYIIGISGLLGSESAKLLHLDGHEIRGLSLDEIPSGLNLDTNIQIDIGNYLQMSETELAKLLNGSDALIFASGLDERVKIKPPAFETFNKYNVDPLQKILKVAKNVGIKHTVILGSYFTYFNETRPQLKLAKYHPYIKSRELQKEVAFSFVSDDFNVAIVELPYIFGVQEERKPVWTFLIEMIHKMGKRTYYPQGGSAMITVRQAAEAIKGTLLINKGAHTYPISYYNLSWKEMLTIMHKAIGEPKRKIVVLPKFIYKWVMHHIYKKDLKNGFEGGLNLGKFSDMHCSNQFISNETAIYLGVTPDDISQAIFDSARLSHEILMKNKRVVEMKVIE